jgi:ferredoxin-type protein NapH
MGAFYSLIGKLSPVKVAAGRRVQCDDCADCYQVCPEPQVLKPALKGPSDLIASSLCTNCGRCIDVCPKDVFQFAVRISEPRE